MSKNQKSETGFNNYINKMIPKVRGIYKITNKSNNKIYIGESLDVKKRWMEHKNSLNNNNHYNNELQSDYNLYGKDSFDFNLIQECIDEDFVINQAKLIILEAYYINKYRKQNIELYNSENTLQLMLNEEKCLYNQKLERYVLIQHLKKYKIIEICGIAIFVNRLIPIKVFQDITNINNDKVNEVYKMFINALLINEYTESELIKKSSINTKIRVFYIEELTELGYDVFVEKANKYIENIGIKNKRKNKKTNCNIKQDISKYKNPSQVINIDEDKNYILMSNFIKNIIEQNTIENDEFIERYQYNKIKEWTSDIGLTFISMKRAYITLFSYENNILVNTKILTSHIDKLFYYSIGVTENGNKYITDLFNGLSEEKKNSFKERLYKQTTKNIKENNQNE